jgi:hypothetical protein
MGVLAMGKYFTEKEEEELVNGFRMAWEAIADDYLQMTEEKEIDREEAFEAACDADRPVEYGEVGRELMLRFYKVSREEQERLGLLAFPDQHYGY